MVISVDDAQRQFVFVKGNRPVNVRAVKQKEKSMKAYGQLTPITVTDGERVIQMGGRLVDLKGNEIPDGDAGKYYAVLDGQHRLVAYQNLGLDLNDLVICEPLNAELSITEIIAQMNICTTVWKKSDYMAAPAMMLKEANEVFDFAMFPARQGLSPLHDLVMVLRQEIPASKRLGGVSQYEETARNL